MGLTDNDSRGLGGSCPGAPPPRDEWQMQVGRLMQSVVFVKLARARSPNRAPGSSSKPQQKLDPERGNRQLDRERRSY
eukprot:9081483-Alexandrium_andersonii.AAC.1